jgi:hemoglobin-like flavoprotein
LNKEWDDESRRNTVGEAKLVSSDAIADTAAALFYQRLFEIAPQVKPLFKGDIKAQGKKLMTMINTVVLGLDSFEALAPTIRDLGKRHKAYGVKDADYDSVGAALLWTLEQGLKDKFTTRTKEAWTKAYGALAGTMKDAAHAEWRQIDWASNPTSDYYFVPPRSPLRLSDQPIARPHCFPPTGSRLASRRCQHLIFVLASDLRLPLYIGYPPSAIRSFQDECSFEAVSFSSKNSRARTA